MSRPSTSSSTSSSSTSLVEFRHCQLLERTPWGWDVAAPKPKEKKHTEPSRPAQFFDSPALKMQLQRQSSALNLPPLSANSDKDSQHVDIDITIKSASTLSRKVSFKTQKDSIGGHRDKELVKVASFSSHESETDENLFANESTSWEDEDSKSARHEPKKKKGLERSDSGSTQTKPPLGVPPLHLPSLRRLGSVLNMQRRDSDVFSLDLNSISVLPLLKRSGSKQRQIDEQNDSSISANERILLNRRRVNQRYRGFPSPPRTERLHRKRSSALARRIKKEKAMPPLYTARSHRLQTEMDHFVKTKLTPRTGDKDGKFMSWLHHRRRGEEDGIEDDQGSVSETSRDRLGSAGENSAEHGMLIHHHVDQQLDQDQESQETQQQQQQQHNQMSPMSQHKPQQPQHQSHLHQLEFEIIDTTSVPSFLLYQQQHKLRQQNHQQELDQQQLPNKTVCIYRPPQDGHRQTDKLAVDLEKIQRQPMFAAKPKKRPIPVLRRHLSRVSTKIALINSLSRE